MNIHAIVPDFRKREFHMIIQFCYIYVIYCLHGILTCQSCYSKMFIYFSLNVVYLQYMDVSGFFMLHAKPKLFFFFSSEILLPVFKKKIDIKH